MEQVTHGHPRGPADLDIFKGGTMILVDTMVIYGLVVLGRPEPTSSA